MVSTAIHLSRDDKSDVFLANNSFAIHLLDGLKVWNGASFIDPGTEQAKFIRTGTVLGVAATITESATTSDLGPMGIPDDLLAFANFTEHQSRGSCGSTTYVAW